MSGSASVPHLLPGLLQDDALVHRNAGWEGHSLVPAWVDPEDVGLDAFFTRPEIARDCYQSLLVWMRDDGAVAEAYSFLEPSAGTGAFYGLLPEGRRVGVDLIPYRPEYEVADFLSWSPQRNGTRWAVVGNPPFGHRSWLALAFVNHAAAFADYLGMILPMSFQSDGKGSPKHRVRGLRLLHTDYLPPDAFTDIHGSSVKVNALWQVWHRGVNNSRRRSPSSSYIDVFTVDARSHRLCGHNRLHEADYFLERTFYGESPPLVEDFNQIRHCGYGVVIKRERARVRAVLRAADWRKYSNLAAHNCRHISMQHIGLVLADAGMVNH